MRAWTNKCSGPLIPGLMSHLDCQRQWLTSRSDHYSLHKRVLWTIRGQSTEIPVYGETKYHHLYHSLLGLNSCYKCTVRTY